MRTATERRGTAATAAGIVFVAALIVAFPLYLARGNEQWFYLDDWDYLATRSLSLHDLLRPHNEHWTTVPIIVYRLMWRFFGLRTYVPYQVLIVSLHLVAAVLLRRIMRRAGVGPWVATAAASLFLFLGSGRENIVWAFQIGFVGALVCGLAHVLFADHDGPPDRRDAVGVGFGVLGLMCSGVALTMAVVVGVAVLVRRGWWSALVNTLPLALVYGIWYAAYGVDASQTTKKAFGVLPRFVLTGFANTFGKMGQLPGVDVALAVMLVAGLIVAWARLPLGQLRRRAAVPAAMLLGAAVFLTTAGGRFALGLGRGFDAFGRTIVFTPEFARTSRYVHIVAALAIPAIAVAADALVRRWRPLFPVVIVLLVVGIPGNIDAIRPTGLDRFTLGDRSIVNLPRSPLAGDVPRSLQVEPFTREVNMGWLLDSARSGRLPTPDLTPDEVAGATLRIVLDQSTEPVPVRDCAALASPVTLPLDRADVFVFRGGALAARTPLGGGRMSSPRILQPFAGRTVRVEGGPVTVSFSSAAPAQVVELCRGA